MDGDLSKYAGFITGQIKKVIVNYPEIHRNNNRVNVLGLENNLKETTIIESEVIGR